MDQAIQSTLEEIEGPLDNEGYCTELCSLVSLWEELSNMRRIVEVDARMPKRDEEAVKRQQQLKGEVEALEAFFVERRERLEHRVSVTDNPPLLVTVCTTKGLTCKERRFFEYFFGQALRVSSVIGVSLLHHENLLPTAAAFAGLSIAELIALYERGSEEFEELLALREMSLHETLQGARRKPRAIVKALLGLELDKEQRAILVGSSLEAIIPPREGGPEEDAGDMPGRPIGVLRSPFDEPDFSLDGGSESRGGDLPSEGSSHLGEDMAYLEKAFEYLVCEIELKKFGTRGELDADDRKKVEMLEADLLIARAELRECICSCEREGRPLPRLEQVAAEAAFDKFERCVMVLMLGLTLSKRVRRAYGRRPISVDAILDTFVDSLQGRFIGRKRYFSPESPLVSRGLVVVTQVDAVSMEERVVAYLLGLETDTVDGVEGAHLYTPTVSWDDLVLPQEQKTLIIDTVKNHSLLMERRDSLDLGSLINKKGVVLLFHGPSGTGKTMAANALASAHGKRILLFNFARLGDVMTSDRAIETLFAEAKLRGAILFIDECEMLFASRDRLGGNELLPPMLTALERHDGIVILASNRAHEMDDAMGRRITLSVEFAPPDETLREKIWASHLAGLRLRGDVDLRNMAKRYELTGGLIKNAVVAAVTRAVGRMESPDDDLELMARDLRAGVGLQMTPRNGSRLHRPVEVPRLRLDDLVLPSTTKSVIEELISVGQSCELLNEWGFGDGPLGGLTVAALFHGPPGVGKTAATEVVAHKIGRPLQVVDTARILSKYVGESALRIDEVFARAQREGAILSFEEADGLLGARTPIASSTDKYANSDVGVLLHHLERHQGVVLLTTNLVEHIDQAVLRRMSFVVEFPWPDRDLRRELWRVLLPPSMPLEEDLDIEELAKFDLSGAQIRTAIFRAAVKASSQKRFVRSADMREAIAMVSGTGKGGRKIGFGRSNCQ